MCKIPLGLVALLEQKPNPGMEWFRFEAGLDNSQCFVALDELMKLKHETYITGEGEDKHIFMYLCFRVPRHKRFKQDNIFSVVGDANTELCFQLACN